MTRARRGWFETCGVSTFTLLQVGVSRSLSSGPSDVDRIRSCFCVGRNRRRPMPTEVEPCHGPQHICSQSVLCNSTCQRLRGVSFSCSSLPAPGERAGGRPGGHHTPHYTVVYYTILDIPYSLLYILCAIH